MTNAAKFRKICVGISQCQFTNTFARSATSGSKSCCPCPDPGKIPAAQSVSRAPGVPYLNSSRAPVPTWACLTICHPAVAAAVAVPAAVAPHPIAPPAADRIFGRRQNSTGLLRSAKHGFFYHQRGQAGNYSLRHNCACDHHGGIVEKTFGEHHYQVVPGRIQQPELIGEAH